MSGASKYLFIQYASNEHRCSFINGQLRITQQQYYRNVRNQVSDPLEGEQLLHASGEIFTLFGNHSTYIWCSSEIYREELAVVKKHDGYDHGLLILEPKKFIDQVLESLNNASILKNHADISFEHVRYVNKSRALADNPKKTLSRWTKPLEYSDERELRLCVHNVPPMEIIEEYFPEEQGRIVKRYTPNDEVNFKQTFYTLVFDVDFDFDYELYSFNGTSWCKEKGGH
jgi:hypothetical protein